MRFRRFIESIQVEETLWTIYQRVREEFDRWLAEYQENDLEAVSDIMNDPSEFLRYLDEFTTDHYDFGIREDGLIEPERITLENTKIIGELPIVVYHHSTDAVEDEIKRSGLKPSGQYGVKKVNSYMNTSSGVYVTTEYGYNAVRGYQNHAIQAHGGNPRIYVIRTTIRQLQDDPDDADLGWSQGRQFVLRYVAPGDILDESNFQLGNVWMEAYEDHMDRIQQAAYGRDFAFEHWFPEGQDRIYLPFEVESEEAWANDEIDDQLVFDFIQEFKGGGKFPESEDGYEVVDYQKGLAAPKNKLKQVFKIGKVINAAEKMDVKQLEQKHASGEISQKKLTNELGRNHRYYNDVRQSFEMSPTRSGGKKGKSQYMVVISKNIHDIGRMSTGREWTSCMNLDAGEHRKSVYCEVKNGGFVAYLTDPEDKEIQRPKARIHIRRFDPKKKGKPSIAMPEESVYGWDVPGFLEFIQKWVDSQQPKVRPGRYRMRGGQRSDTYDRDQMVVPKSRKRLWKWVDEWTTAKERGDEERAQRVNPYMMAAMGELLKLDKKKPLPKDEAKKVYNLIKQHPAIVQQMAHGSVFASFAKQHPDIVEIGDLEGLGTYDLERVLPTLPPETQSIIKKQVYDWLMDNMQYPSPGIKGSHYDSGVHARQGYYSDMLSKTHIFKPIPDPLVKKMVELYHSMDEMPLSKREQTSLAGAGGFKEFGTPEAAIQGSIAHAFYMTGTDSPSVIDFYKQHADKTGLDFKAVPGHNSWTHALAHLGKENGAQFLPYLRKQKEKLERELAELGKPTDWHQQQEANRLRQYIEEYNYVIDSIETGKPSQKYEAW